MLPLYRKEERSSLSVYSLYYKERLLPLYRKEGEILYPYRKERERYYPPPTGRRQAIYTLPAMLRTPPPIGTSFPPYTCHVRKSLSLLAHKKKDSLPLHMASLYNTKIKMEYVRNKTDREMKRL